MKNLIISAFLLFSISSYAVTFKDVIEINSENSIVNSEVIDETFNDYVDFVCDYLGIENQVIRFGTTDLQVQGCIFAADTNNFVILINKRYCDNIRIAIAHELTHLKQHINGEWNINEGTNRIVNGECFYVSDKARDIELEAINNSHIILSAYCKNCRHIKTNKRRSSKI